MQKASFKVVKELACVVINACVCFVDTSVNGRFKLVVQLHLRVVHWLKTTILN